MEWKKSWEKLNEPPLKTWKAGIHSKMWSYIWFDWKGILYYELFTQKAATDEKNQELANQKLVSH